MIRILIVDDGRDDRYRILAKYPGLVDYVDAREASATTESFDASSYATAFVHSSSPKPEVKHPAVKTGQWATWAKERFRPVFIFSGGTTAPNKTRHIVNLPRDMFLDRLPAVLDRLSRSGEVSPDLFEAAVVAASSEGSVAQRGTTRCVTFTLESPDPERLVFAIYSEASGNVDYAKTLAPLAAVGDPAPVVIEEHYASDGRHVDGLALLRRLRFGSFLGGTFSRWPVVFKHAAPLAELIGSDSRAAILVTRGVALQEGEGRDLLSEAELLRMLEMLPVEPGSGDSNHDVANRWGPVRLWVGHRLIRGEAVTASTWRTRAADLLGPEAYWHTLSRALLRQRKHEEARGLAPSSTGEIETWRAFLRDWLQRQGRPLRVLYVDDEGHRGWNASVRALFGEVPGAGDVTCYPGDAGESDTEPQVDDAGLNALVSGPWDLVLADLRLRASDRALSEDADPERRAQYSGLAFLRAVKQDRPPTPVVAFTASNKSWTHAAVREAGGAGYWVKESPEQGASDAYSCRNAAELLALMQKAVAFTEQRGFLWDMIEDLRREKSRLTSLFERLHAPVKEKKLSGFDQLGAMKENLGVPDRLDQIEELWLRAYGYLQARPTLFERDAYRFAPENVAFLHLYGSLNQIRALRFRLGAHDAAMLRRNGVVEPIADGGAWASKMIALVQQVSLSRKDREAAKPWDAGDRHHDALYNGLLLIDGGRTDLERRLNGEMRGSKKTEGLRDLRNHLDIIHSDAAHADIQSHATLDDHLPAMCDILRCALLLVPSGQSGLGKAAKGQAPRADSAVTRTGAARGTGQP